MSYDVIRPADIHPEPGLYTHAFAGSLEKQRLVVVSGQLGIKPDGSIHTDFAGQFHQTYDNLRTVLGEGGADFADIVSLRTYLSRTDLLPEFHELRRRHYPDWFPEAAGRRFRSRACRRPPRLRPGIRCRFGLGG